MGNEEIKIPDGNVTITNVARYNITQLLDAYNGMLEQNLKTLKKRHNFKNRKMIETIETCIKDVDGLISYLYNCPLEDCKTEVL